jgi:hypothetical protein
MTARRLLGAFQGLEASGYPVCVEFVRGCAGSGSQNRSRAETGGCYRKTVIQRGVIGWRPVTARLAPRRGYPAFRPCRPGLPFAMRHSVARRIQTLRCATQPAQPVPPPRSAPKRLHSQTRQALSPSTIRSCGSSIPMNTILLFFVSIGCHLAARSLPIIWCTPWNTTLRSTPFI